MAAISLFYFKKSRKTDLSPRCLSFLPLFHHLLRLGHPQWHAPSRALFIVTTRYALIVSSPEESERQTPFQKS